MNHEINRGKGAALKTAYQHIQSLISADNTSPVIVGTMDADGQHTPEDMQRVMNAAAVTLGTLALGVRTVDKHMPFRSRMGNAITRGVFRLLTGARVSDTQTGLRAFSSDMISFMISIEGDRYEYEMNVLSATAKRFGTKGFSEVPIETIYRDQENSTSHFHPVRDSFRIYRHLFKFAGSSLISFLVDYGLFCLFSWLLGPWIPLMAVTVANISARIISAVVNYNLNCRVVFEGKPTPKNALEYALLCGFILAVNCSILYLLGLTPIPIWICKLITEACMFFVSYIFQKKIIFKSSKP
ncbi:MAG: glycosyltransferase [Ruminococcaceae bacterium]|nr:glycosyltransferase [Oscillospiraceae bacterium]